VQFFCDFAGGADSLLQKSAWESVGLTFFCKKWIPNLNSKALKITLNGKPASENTKNGQFWAKSDMPLASLLHPQ
jgi:hypothetical protein